jgi:hypothetical protein
VNFELLNFELFYFARLHGVGHDSQPPTLVNRVKTSLLDTVSPPVVDITSIVSVLPSALSV